MSRSVPLAVAIAVLFCAAASRAQEEVKLPIRKVVLYKHGVGYFERIGKVRGDATIPLRFKAKDMSDLLKSLTVLDLGGGTIRTIAYESTKTVDQQLAEYTFNLRAAQSLPAILEQMKGSEVAITVAGKEMKGRILAVEKRLERRDDAQVEIYRLSLLLDGAVVKNFDLSDVADIRFSDPRLQKELQDYLAILFSRHRRDQKEVAILASGKGEREIFVSYVQEQPVWKVSYRVVLEKKEKPLLQAWAIVDNVSEEDWENVNLSLVSGLPVSFAQNLYDPWYVQRPTVAVQRETAARPVMYDAGDVAATAEFEGRAKEVQPRRNLESERKALRGAAEMAGAGLMGAAPAAPPAVDAYALMSRQVTAAVAQAAGALFVYDIKEPVTVRRDRSALLPIVNAPVEATRVSIYNETARPTNPMEAVRLKNTTGKTLEGGPVTVVEENTYAGEALMDTLKADEERYISFAVDLGTRVNTKLGSSSQNIYRVRIVRGTLFTDYKQQETKTYNLTNVEPKEKIVVVEHPFRQGWNLVDTPKPIEITPNHYRFEVKVPAKGKVEFKVTEEMPGSSSVALTNLSRDQIIFYVRQKYIDEKTRAFLEKVCDLQAQIAALNQQVSEQERQRNEIFNNQNRLRQNLSTMRQTEEEKALRTRYIKQLEAEEDRLEAITRTIGELKAKQQALQTELDKMLAEFTFETKA